MIEDIKIKLMEKVSLVPGIYGFANLDPEITGQTRVLPKESWGKAMLVSEGGKGIILNLAVILIHSVNAKNVASEIHSLVSYYFKENNLKLEDFSIVIRGIKR